ncbi:hypothetical protein [Georgenia muralis]
MSTEPFLDAGDMYARRRDADRIALDDHASTSAEPALRIIATHLWAVLRTLGFTDGRVLAVGDAAGPLIGLPNTDGNSLLSAIADITPAQIPGRMFTVRVGMPRAYDRFDVVVASLPYNDIRLQHPEHVVARRAVQAQLAVAMQRLTRPGGYTMLLASHDLMDHPFSETRRQLHIGGDLLGAVRLPAGALRRLPGLDLPTDLLILRRRPDGLTTQSQEFEHTTTIHVDGRDVEINTYFENNVDQILGTVGADPLAWGPAAVTVSNAPDRLDRDLANALSTVTAHALRKGLTCTPDAAPPLPHEPSVTDAIRRPTQATSSLPRPHRNGTNGQGGLTR